MTEWHIVTGEYPPATGGVADYSHAVASGLAAAGDRVHVWCPAAAGDQTPAPGVHVHPVAGSWSGKDFIRLDEAIDQTAGPRRLLVQWVPQAFGRKSINVAFCRWVRRRARAGDILDVMVHEPYLPFGSGSVRLSAAAVIHRAMVALLLDQARRVWVAIPAWADCLRPWTFGKAITFCWLPVPSNIPVSAADQSVIERREQVLRGSGGVIVGHFSTYSPEIMAALRELLPTLLAGVPEMHVELMGRGSEKALGELSGVIDPRTERVRASGDLTAAEMSCRLRMCDLIMQPYPDGASTRRGTLMAALAHGLPVATTTGHLTEAFWRESGAVALAPAGNLPELARLVSELSREPARRRRLGSAGRDTYEARFSLQHLIHSLRSDLCEAA